MSEKKTSITESNTSSQIEGHLSKWKMYAKISNLGPILRRYFVMNAFDGVLTALGLIIGSFIIFLKEPDKISQLGILIPGISTTLAIGISGMMGAYLAETAERRKSNIELHKDMAEILEDDNETVQLKEEDYYPQIELEENSNIFNGEEIEHIDVDPKPVQYGGSKVKTGKNSDNELEIKSDAEKAEGFASTILSFTDGLSPAIGSIIGLFPFFFAQPNMIIFIISFILEVLILFSLGVYLAKISEDSIVKYGLQMVLAGLVTCGISLLIGGGH